MLYWHADDGRFAKADQPNPADEAIHVHGSTPLSWTAGVGSTSHGIYFGTVDPPPFVAEASAATWSPGLLEHDQKYYWRVDEVTSFGLVSGPLWTFTTRLLPGDFDFDGDVDMEDFGHLQECLSEELIPYEAGCGDADLDYDGDVDPADLADLLACLSGPGTLSPCD